MTVIYYALGIMTAIALPPIIAIIYFNLKRKYGNISKSEANDSPFIKKYPKLDFNRYTATFRGVGLVVALGIAIAVFLYEQPVNSPLDKLAGWEESIDIFEPAPPATHRKPTPPPPPITTKTIRVVKPTEVIKTPIEPLVIDTVSSDITFSDLPPEIITNEPKIFIAVEEMPNFSKDCIDLSKSERKACNDLEVQKYIAKIKYPDIARENDIEGRVYVRFVVNEKGKVVNVEVLKSTDNVFVKCAESHMKSMPDWDSPGKQRGKPVKVQYTVPIKFHLN